MTISPRSGRSRLLDAMPDVALELDAEGRVVDFAGPPTLGGGITPACFLGRRLVDALPEALRARFGEAIEKVQTTSQPGGFDFAMPGAKQHFEARICRLDGRGVALYLRDVTAHKRVELLAEETEARFRTMADSAPVLLWMSDTTGDCVFFNEPWLRFTGRTLEEERGVGWTEGVHAEDLQHCLHVYTSAFTQRIGFRMEYRLRRSDGQYRWVLDTGTPRYAPDGTFTGYVGSCVDIQELKAAHAELEARVCERTTQLRVALCERETLLKEIHHRVKNNLQVISSLLALQARQVRSDHAVAAAMADIQGRVRSIALAHEHLYASDHLGRLDFPDYVRELTRSLEQTFGHGAVIALDIAPIALVVDQAIACGLVVNELVTNAFKYAFPDREDGTIRVSLHVTDGVATLEVKDDGIGIPDRQAKPQSLGLSLVATLAEQLGGELERVRGAGVGACFRVTFPSPTAPAALETSGQDERGRHPETARTTEGAEEALEDLGHDDARLVPPSVRKVKF